MRIFVSHSKKSNYIKELYEPIRGSQLGKENSFLFPYESIIQVNTKDIIRNSDLIIAEVSNPSTGQGIELGWANFLEIPIVCVYKETVEISKSLKYISDIFIPYKNSTHLVELVSKHLSTKNI